MDRQAPPGGRAGDPRSAPPGEPDLVPGRAVFAASLSLFLFGMMTGLALIAWFARAESPWSWRSAVAALTMTGSLAASVLVWRDPSHRYAFAGIGVLVISLLRTLGPDEWTWASYVLVILTCLALIPLVHLVIVLPRGR